MTRPSPFARPLNAVDPHAGRLLTDLDRARAKRQAVAAGHPCAAPYDHERERNEVTVLIACTLPEHRLIVDALAVSSSAASRELAVKVAEQRRRSWLFVDSDPTPANGVVRP